MSDMLSIVKLWEEYEATTDCLFGKMEQLRERLLAARGEDAYGIERRIDLLQCEINDMRTVCFYLRKNYGSL